MRGRFSAQKLFWMVIAAVALVSAAPAVLAELAHQLAPTLALLVMLAGIVGLGVSVASWRSRQRMQGRSDPRSRL